LYLYFRAAAYTNSHPLSSGATSGAMVR
jgi:hypothetical protein